MNILKLQASNVMNIEAVEIEPNGNSVTLMGKNGAGKSAFLKAIEFALSGKALASTPEPVVSDDEKVGVHIEAKEV